MRCSKTRIRELRQKISGWQRNPGQYRKTIEVIRHWPGRKFPLTIERNVMKLGNAMSYQCVLV